MSDILGARIRTNERRLIGMAVGMGMPVGLAVLAALIVPDRSVAVAIAWFFPIGATCGWVLGPTVVPASGLRLPATVVAISAIAVVLLTPGCFAPASALPGAIVLVGIWASLVRGAVSFRRARDFVGRS